MPGAFMLSYIQLRRRKFREEGIRRQRLRDTSNPMDLLDSSFIGLYRINKSAFTMILTEIAPLMRNSSIPEKLQLAATLRFLAVGGFQGVIANSMEICIGRSTMCKILENVLSLLENKICPTWINLEMDGDEIEASKLYFYEKYGIPGVIGCVDGSFIRILKPIADESLYYNRKGYFSLNVMIICDYKMRIRAVDGCRPGSCHDSYIWSMSDARKYFEENQHIGCLLADKGYPLETFVMTPYRNPQFGSNEHLFNKKHAKGRKIIERTIGNLKSRFRCLLDALLPYQPLKVVKIVNVCCALHNICKSYNIRNENPITYDSVDDYDDYEVDEEIGHNEEAATIRNNIANSLIFN